MAANTGVPALVEPTWLHDQMAAGNPSLRIFDCSLWLQGLLEEDYRRQHIAGAQFLSVFEGGHHSSLQPVAVPDSAAFQKYVRGLGVGRDSHVILYESVELTGFTAPRIWWTFRLYGHDKVSVLNGGLKRWIREGFPVTSDPTPKPQEGDFTARLRPELLARLEDLLPGRLPPQVQVVDARPADMWAAREKEPSSLLQAFAPCIHLPLDKIQLASGHVPGSRNVPYPSMFTQDAMDTLKDEASIAKLFEEAGVDVRGPMVCTCYVGMTACILALGAAACGNLDVKVYAGSWVEYGQKAPADQVETAQ